MTKSRILLLDAVRGLGVLGILLCNIPDFASAPPTNESLTLWPHGHSVASVAIWLSTQIFFREKFVTLFSMLFGVSIFLVGGERSDRARSAALAKRLAWLVVFGLIHGFLIWYGDILLDYALAGFVVMFCRSWPAKRLLLVGIALLVAWNAFGYASAISFYGQPASVVQAGDPAMVAQAAKATKAFSGTFSQSLHANIDVRTPHGPFEIINIIWGTALMLTGLGLFKVGVFTGEAPQAAYWTLLAAGGVSLVLLMMAGSLLIVTNSTPAAVFWFGGIEYMFPAFVSLGYVALLVFASRSQFWVIIPRTLAPVGQMAFTNYLTQSLMMTCLFYGGRGPDLFGQLDRPALLGIVIAVWATQIIWSHLWLKHFQSGPFEWIWRRLYRGPTRLRRGMPPTDLVPA